MSSVSMDGMRHQLVEAYRTLCNRLNLSRIDDEIVNIEIERLQEPMDELRELIAVMCCVYSEKEEMFTMIRDQVGDIPHFNLNLDE